ncbi:PAS domain-containing protein [Halapricum sp. CBA1109]|uniref:ATP-binding response regulator n=1 Tax=Halapricum sp. CBA1109 TaxID=2668068 RepID=UPI0012FAD4F6|nr:ATP-binding protein [Halapricum sp. CBA1109]MUV90140.1 PAS domain-containing protein [Halapricum sp. CBA1109]
MVGPSRVLYVESDREFAGPAVTALEAALSGGTVELVHDAGAARARIAEAAFDCVVSAQTLPETAGTDLCAWLREVDPTLPFVLLADGPVAVGDAVAAGVTATLGKASVAADGDRLTAAVAAAVDRERDRDRYGVGQAVEGYGAWTYDARSGAFHTTESLRRLHGHAPETPLDFDQSVADYHPDDREAVRSAFRRAADAGESFDVDARLGEDEPRWVRVRGYPQSVDGTVVLVRGTTRDITDSRRRERNLRQRNERLEEFAQVVSHDIRNPLQVADGNLGLAEETCDSAAFERVRAAHRRIEAIVDDLLTLAQQGRHIAETEPVDVVALARESLTTSDAPSVTLSAVGECRVEADPDRLRQLFENLFRNADEHPPGEVTVTVGPVDPMATTTRAGGDQKRGFYVADDGPGIPDEQREQVFEPGYTRAEDGTGFGLAIVAQITDAHGWDARVTESLDGGARFEFLEQS